MDDFYTRTDDSDTEITLEVTLPADAVESAYQHLLQERGKGLDIKGFRKGMVPSDLVEPSLEKLLLSETFENLAPYFVNAALIKEKIEPIAPPEYSDLEELKKGTPVKFKVKVTVMPEFKLGDLKKVKVDKEEPKITDKEIQETLDIMRNNNAAHFKKEEKDIKIDDEWAKEIATLYRFEDVKDLKALKEMLKKMLKEQKISLKQQLAATEVMTQAVKLSDIKVPEAAVKYEAQQREEAFMEDLERAKMDMRTFLKERELKYEDLKERWEKDALEALETDVLLKLFSEKRSIEVEDEELKQEVEKIKSSAKMHYEQEHAGHDHPSEFDETVYDNPQWQAQIKSYLVKQKAYQQLMDEVLGEDFFKTADDGDDKESGQGKNKKADDKQPVKEDSEKKKED